MAEQPRPPAPGRYQAPSGRTYLHRPDGGWHLVYRSGHVSQLVVGPAGAQRADVDAVLVDPAAAGARYAAASGRCACCNRPADDLDAAGRGRECRNKAEAVAS